MIDKKKGQNFKKTKNKKELIKKLWDISEKGEFRPYSEYRKEKGFC